MYFRNYRLRNRWLDKFLKSPVTKNNLTGNLVNGSKHCFNVNDSVNVIDHCEGNWVGKSLS